MAELDAKAREALKDSDFAYVDSSGGRHLPIHDEEHVRAAMSRFNQTTFESDAAKATARRKILAACKRFGITPANFSDEDLATIADFLYGLYDDMLDPVVYFEATLE